MTKEYTAERLKASLLKTLCHLVESGEADSKDLQAAIAFLRVCPPEEPTGLPEHQAAQLQKLREALPFPKSRIVPSHKSN